MSAGWPKRRALRARRGFWRDERATAAIEIGLIALPLTLLLVGLVEVGRGLHVMSAVNEAADRGQRLLMIDPDASANTVAAAIREGFHGGDGDDLSVEIAEATIDGETYQRITLGYDLRLLIPSPIGRTVTISAEQLTFIR